MQVNVVTTGLECVKEGVSAQELNQEHANCLSHSQVFAPGNYPLGYSEVIKGEHLTQMT